ncbi:2571_t:CDS:2 [Acaulospora colombiana]|uniref:2571_t:CDS:1 n=1 Tax=Acaulospora colombiana TaxID=27376 RepID=A0ACA9LCU8_9GLOM|nr:2571_t:CDS:2 [Acaulospora colombiana]
MSSASGIGAAPELVECFAQAVTQNDLRVIKVSIKNEALVESGKWNKQGDFMSDYAHIVNYVEDNVPAYLLVRLDSASGSEWLSISYVPDNAKVRDKMLYASTQSALKKALGDYRFKDSIFATSKADLTTDGYEAHQRHVNAPKPLSAREEAMQSIRAAEKAAGLNKYQGAGERRSHAGSAPVGFKWTSEAEDAVKDLANREGCSKLVILSVNTRDESLVLKQSSRDVSPNQLASFIPSSEPTYTFYLWSRQRNGEDLNSISMWHLSTMTIPNLVLVFIYCCPSGSPVKHRMVYSSGVVSVVNAAKGMGVSVAKRSETSDPEDINEAFLQQELSNTPSGSSTPVSGERVAFAKPRGPPRRR